MSANQTTDPPVHLLEATLRDGSYSVSFQHTGADVAVMVSLLDQAGLSFVELGNGYGSFNDSAPKRFRVPIPQGAPDDEYFAAARAAATHAKLGVITGPFAINEIDRLVEHNFDFVRLAVMADEAITPAGLAFVEKSKSLGLITSVNLMQSIALSPQQMAAVSSEFAKAGADWIYVVDSAGGMLPDDVKRYIQGAGSKGSVRVGFHGHHNSGLAVANALAAIEAGATLVDGTLQGMGRGPGNAPTEQLLLLLQRLGYEGNVDVDRVLALGDLVRVHLDEKGFDPTQVATGVAQLHSANLGGFRAFAENRQLSTRSLLAGVAKVGTPIVGFRLTEFPAEVIEPAIELARPERRFEAPLPVVESVAKEMTSASDTTLERAVHSLTTRARRRHKTSILHLANREVLPFPNVLPWTIGPYAGTTLPVPTSGVLADLGHRTPDVLVVEDTLQWTLPDDVRVVSIAGRQALADGVALLVANLTDAEKVWIVAPAGTVQDVIRARVSTTTARGDASMACEVTSELPQWKADVSPRDYVIIASREIGDLQPLRRELGPRLLRPAIGQAVASHVMAFTSLEEVLGREPDGDFVDATFIALPEQITVDDSTRPNAVVSASSEGLEKSIHRAAEYVVQMLVNGESIL